MSDKDKVQSIHTRIWREEPESDNPYATRAAHCHGYDVYGEMLGNARWVEMLYLLFRGEAPTRAQADTLEALAVALANPGPRDPSVHAAMCAGIGGSTSAASLMAAIAVGAGFGGGAREVFVAMQGWKASGHDVAAWQTWLTNVTTAPATGVWPAASHAPGFDPHALCTSTIVRQSLDRLAQRSPGNSLSWLAANRVALESAARHPLALSGVAAAALVDLGFTPEQGEVLFLLLRLPGAAAHALEQRGQSYKHFPFFSLELQDDDATDARRATEPTP
jgi:citrate synthase